jgi:hypothetical protein
MFLLYKNIEINCMALYIPFDSLKKNVIKHLIKLVYRTKNDIYIIFKLFENIFIILARDHIIYWHTTIHYNYNNIKLKKSKVVFHSP